MVGKTTPEQRETENIIDAEYQEIEDEKNHHQMSISELFFQEHEKKLEEEQLKKQAKNDEALEIRANKSKHPLLTSMFGNDFSNDQIDYLYDGAIKERVAGYVDCKDWEMFAADMISDYYVIIKADAENTRTTPYKRLLDMLRRDYNNLAFKYQAKYKKK